MTKSTNKTNSTIAVNIDQVVSDAMREDSNSDGRELRMAVALYHAENISVSQVLGQTRKEQATALGKIAPSFVSKQKELVEAKEKAKSKGGNAVSKMNAALAVPTLQKSYNAALSMFKRALFGAYYLSTTHAHIEPQTSKDFIRDGHIAVTFPEPQVSYVALDAIAKGKKGNDEPMSEQVFYAKSLRDEGMAKAKADGAYTAVKSNRSGTGAGVSGVAELQSVSSISGAASTMSALIKKQDVDTVDTPENNELYNVLTLKMFADEDGTIDVRTIIEHFAEQGLNFDLTGIKDAVKKRA